MSRPQPATRSAYTVSGAFLAMGESDLIAEAMLEPVRSAFHRRSNTEYVRNLTGGHRDRYVRELLDGTKPISLRLFVKFLLGYQCGGSEAGRAFVVDALTPIARTFGLAIVPVAQQGSGDLEIEVREANLAIHDAFHEVAQADPSIPAQERRVRRVAKLSRVKSEIDDVLAAVSR